MKYAIEECRIMQSWLDSFNKAIHKTSEYCFWFTVNNKIWCSESDYYYSR